MSNSYMPKSFRFERLLYTPYIFEKCYNLCYLPEFFNLYSANSKYMDDDFSNIESSFRKMLNFLSKTSYCFIVLEGNNLCGFFALENLKGSFENPYSAEVIMCFDRKYWGKFTKITAQIFKDFCFKTLNFKKLKAVIYPQNLLVKKVLEMLDFKFEAVLKSETIREGKCQDIEIYSVLSKN